MLGLYDILVMVIMLVNIKMTTSGAKCVDHHFISVLSSDLYHFKGACYANDPFLLSFGFLIPQ